MEEKSKTEAVVREIRRKTRRKYSAEEKIRIVLEGLRGEESIASICRREGIASNVYYKWSKDFLEAGKKRLQGDIKRQATSSEVGCLSNLENLNAHFINEDFSQKDRLIKLNAIAIQQMKLLTGDHVIKKLKSGKK